MIDNKPNLNMLVPRHNSSVWTVCAAKAPRQKTEVLCFQRFSICVSKPPPLFIHGFSPDKTRHPSGHPRSRRFWGPRKDVDQRKDATFISLEKFETFAVEPPVVDLLRKKIQKPGETRWNIMNSIFEGVIEIGSILWGGSNLMQMYGDFEGFPF